MVSNFTNPIKATFFPMVFYGFQFHELGHHLAIYDVRLVPRHDQLGKNLIL